MLRLSRRHRWYLPIRHSTRVTTETFISTLLRSCTFCVQVTYQVSITHNSHHAEWLHAITPWIKRRASTLIAKDHVRMDVRIEVGDAVLGDLILECCHPLAARVIGACASPVVRAITVHVHVRICAAVRAGVQKDGTGEITTVGHIASRVPIAEPTGENVGTSAGLECSAPGLNRFGDGKFTLWAS